MRRYNTYIFVLGCIICFIGINACLDEIDLNTGGGDQILIVDGAIYNGQGPHIVKVKRSGAFLQGAAGVESPVSGAMVEIIEIGGRTVGLQETEPGTYTTQAIQGVEGKSYQLAIQIDGESYSSQVEVMPQSVPVDQLDFFLEDVLINDPRSNNLVQQKVLTLLADAQFPEGDEASFLKYRVSGTYEFFEMASPSNLDVNICFVDEIIDLDNIVVINKGDFEQGLVNDLQIITKDVDYRFAFNYCFTVIQQSITRNAYEFWQTVQNEYNRTGDIFESPPSTLRGNVFNDQATKSDVIGLFSAIAESNSAVKVSSIAAGAPRPLCRPFPRPPDECFNCLDIAKSSYVKPPCFE